MGPDEFQHVLHDEIVPFLTGMLATAGQKNREYATSSDRFANFRRRGMRLDTPPDRVLLGDLSKHLDAIEQAVLNSKVNTNNWFMVLPDGKEGYKQRFIDAIALMCLLYGRLEEAYGPRRIVAQGDNTKEGSLFAWA